MRVLARLNPVSYIVDLMRHALGHPTEFAAGFSVLVLAATIVLGFAATAVVFDPEQRLIRRARRSP
ncbi:MAG: hypothetical protein O3A25_11390 [Acidobacteria bacterium]|nr:hypothetical protein [Acidobacteriota bacterium]